MTRVKVGWGLLLTLSVACGGSEDGPKSSNATAGSAGAAASSGGNASSGSGGSSNAGSASGGTAGSGVSTAPPGLDHFPPGQSCNGERCNGQCLTPEAPKNEYCELVVPQYAPQGLFLAADGMLYVGHGKGVGKVAPTGAAALTPVTTAETEFVGKVMVDGDTVYFGVDLAGAGLWRVPTAGGVAEELVPGIIVADMALTAKGLLLATNYSGLQFMSWDGAMASKLGELNDDTFLGQGFAYWQTYPEGIFKAPVDDLAQPTLVGKNTSGDFVVQGGNVYSIGSALEDLYFNGADGSVNDQLWNDGEGQWTGDVNSIRVFPGHDDAVFFMFQTKSSYYLLRWNIAAKTTALIGYLPAMCFSDYLVAGDYAYLSGCQAVYRVKLP